MLRNFRIDKHTIQHQLNRKNQARPHAGLFLLGIILTLAVSACGTGSPSTSPTAMSATQNPNLPQLLLPAPTNDGTNTPVDTTSNVVNDDPYVASDPALFTKLGRPKMVEFFAFWCDVCRSMRPTVHDLQAQYSKYVDFLYLDIDAPNTQDLQTQLNFAGLRPTIVFFDAAGKELGRLTGFHKEEELKPYLDALSAQG